MRTCLVKLETTISLDWPNIKAKGLGVAKLPLQYVTQPLWITLSFSRLLSFPSSSLHVLLRHCALSFLPSVSSSNRRLVSS
jgi:hypothetical protein